MADEATAPPTDVDPDADPFVGKVLDGYELQVRLGGGGFGAVYKAVERETGHIVAAKVLRVDRAALSADARTRFRREAQALVSLRHPRIVAIHAHGTSEEGLEYLVMDLLEGEDLAEHLHRRRRVPVPEALALFDGMAEAVQFAHDQGFAHRDLKPANVFLRDGAGGELEPIVLDFGLAKMVEGSEESLTATGMVLGTPQYMAPEQATGEKVDRRADVYALGAILYEMLTGVPPFVGNTPTAILMKVLTSPPPPISPGLGVPDPVEAAIRKALAKEPEERFDDIAAFRRALSDAASVPMTRMMPAAATDPPPATREARAISSSARRPGSRRWLVPVVVGALVALGTGGVALWMGLRGEGASPVAATAPTQVAMTPTSEEAESDTESESEGDTATEAPPEANDGDTAEELGAPPPEVPEAPPEETPGMRPRPSQMRGRQVTTTADDSAMTTSAMTGPGPSASTATPNTSSPYADDLRRARAQLDEVQRTVAAVAATRRGLRGLGQGDPPSFCGRASGLPSGSEDRMVVTTVQQLRDIRSSACEPFEQARNPDASTLGKLRDIPSTLDRAEEMARDRSVSSNEPADVADQVVDAIGEARRILRGVDSGQRPFPCDAAVFSRLRRLAAGPNSYAGNAAGRVARLQSQICRGLGIAPGDLRQLAERLNTQLDNAEGTIHGHETAIQRRVRSIEALVR